MDLRAQNARRVATFPGWGVMGLSLCLHAAVLTAALVFVVDRRAPAEASFAAGDQPMVVQMQAVTVETDNGPRLRWVAMPPVPRVEAQEPYELVEPEPVEVARAARLPDTATPDPTLPFSDAEPDDLSLPEPVAEPETSEPNAPEPTTVEPESTEPTAEPVTDQATEHATEQAPEQATEPTPTPPTSSSPSPRGVQSDAEKIDVPAPHYPQRSKRLGEEGDVLVEATATVDGRATDVVVIESSGFERLDKAALEAMGKAKLRPAMRGSTPIESRVKHRFRFRLE